MDYYKIYMARYILADEETRQASKKHWQKVFAEAVTSNTDISLAASILAAISLLETA